jgi:hypothetical protein
MNVEHEHQNSYSETVFYANYRISFIQLSCIKILCSSVKCNVCILYCDNGGKL